MTALLALASTWFFALPLHAAAPQLAAPPLREAIQATGKIQFTFSEPMNAAGIDVMWSGTGIDPAKFSGSWFQIPGFPIPPVLLEFTYQGGLPAGVEVKWTLNRGNSGIMKSLLGQALLETSGSFISPGTPGPDPDPGTCEPSNSPTAAAALSLFKEINYIQTGPTDPVFDTAKKAMVNGSVFTSASNAPPAVATSATLNKPVGGSVPLIKVTFDIPIIPGIPIPQLPDTFYLSTTPAPNMTPPTFNSVEELNAAYPNGNYSMTVGISSGGSRTVSLPLNPSPEQPVPTIANYAALQGFNASQNLTIQWNAFTGAGATDIIQLRLRERGGTGSYTAPNKCANIQLLVTDNSHMIPAGTLKAGATYDVELSFSKTTHFRDADATIPPGQANTHIPGYAEFTLLTKTTRLTIGAPAAESSLRFERIFKESNGLIMLEITGSLAAGKVGQVEGSSDFSTWNIVAVVSKVALDALGGIVQVSDPASLTNPPPYNFYRIVIP